MTKIDNLQRLAHDVVSAIRDEDLPGPKRKTETSAIMTRFRPYIERAITGDAPKVINDALDMRQRRWFISPEFWRGIDPLKPHDIRMAIPEGRIYSMSGELVRYGGEWVTGLAGAAELVEQWATHLGAPLDTYASAPMKRAIAYLRPTISREGGYAKMRRVSENKLWTLIMPVWREDAALPEMLETKP